MKSIAWLKSSKCVVSGSMPITGADQMGVQIVETREQIYVKAWG